MSGGGGGSEPGSAGELHGEAYGLPDLERDFPHRSFRWVTYADGPQVESRLRPPEPGDLPLVRLSPVAMRTALLLEQVSGLH